MFLGTGCGQHVLIAHNYGHGGGGKEGSTKTSRLVVRG